jgi:hypothetical protein
MKLYFRNDYNPAVEKVLKLESDIGKLEPTYINSFKYKLIAEHGVLMNGVKAKRQKVKEDKEAVIKAADEAERKRIEDQKIRREERRIKRIESNEICLF